MTLGQMRYRSVRVVQATCNHCRHPVEERSRADRLANEVTALATQFATAGPSAPIMVAASSRVSGAVEAG